MLLCCKDSTLEKSGVQEEIGIASHVMRSIDDLGFIIPMRLEPYAPIFGLANTQYVDFVKSWANGLDKLLEELKKADVPKTNTTRRVSAHWESLRRQFSVSLRSEPERLTLNWIRIANLPDRVCFFESSGAMDHGLFQAGLRASRYPMIQHNRGLITFLNAGEVNEQLSSVGRFVEKGSINTLEFANTGFPDLGIAPREAGAHLVAMFSAAWESYAKERRLVRYEFSGRRPGFHAGADQAKIGERFSWGRQGDRRSSMVRNVARGKVWSYGITVILSLWPFPHLRLKARVMFSDLSNDGATSIITSTEQQFRLRRSVCKGWRNKQWHGRLMAYLELLAGDSAWISIPLSPSSVLRCDAHPLLVSSPVTTDLPNMLLDDEEETDPMLLGGYADESDDSDVGTEGDDGTP